MEECCICFVWGAWEGYAEAWLHRSVKATEAPGVELDHQRLEDAADVMLVFEDIRFAGHPWLLPPISVPLKDSPKNPERFENFGVELKSGQFGEAYHVFICRLLLRGSPIKVDIQFNSGGQTAELIDLFRWYQIPLIEDGRASVAYVSKSEATRVIAAAFRASNESMKASKGGLIDTSPGTQLSQHALFEHIRDCLGPVGPTTTNPQNLQVPTRYFQPCYAAKYWLNRYFRLTRQFDDESRSAHLEDSVSRMAVVHVRRSALSLVGRIMDNETLEYVMRSIEAANMLCREPGKGYAAQVFTHVMLYGDFDYHEGCELKRLFKKKLMHGTIHISFISRPWSPASKKSTELDRQVDELWKQFRDFNVDRLPVQVKILGIWTALRERYGERMCVIGHRSGFVEGAGFLGIPIFYLNNERDNITRARKNEGGKHSRELHNGEMLWNAFAVPNPEDNRLRELADVMDTFIPVEVLCAERDPSKSIYRVRRGFEKELTAALFVYMCCSLISMQPAWTARVRAMHDMPDSVLYNIGQGWLRERCDYAIQNAKI